MSGVISLHQVGLGARHSKCWGWGGLMPQFFLDFRCSQASKRFVESACIRKLPPRSCRCQPEREEDGGVMKSIPTLHLD